MKKHEIQALFNILEPQSVAIAIVKGIVTLNVNKKKLSFNNCTLTSEGKDLIRENSNIRIEDIKSLQAIFPKNWKSSPSAILHKLERFFYENPEYKMSDVLKAATYWVEEKQQYCGKANNFIYLKLKEGGEASRLLEALSSIKDANISYYNRKKKMISDEEESE